MTMSTITPAPRLVFGREPAAWTALISAALVLLTTFGISISTETQGVIIAAVNAVLGLIVVIAVRESIYPALVAVVQTAIPLVVAFGLDLTDAQQGAILAATTVTLGFAFTRPQVTPKTPAA
nr:MAG TPA_asm: holin [Caudoviricetes sp.]